MMTSRSDGLTPQRIAAALATHVFSRKCMLLIPNCHIWGFESDLLCITEDRYVIDVEIKMSRGDLKRDIYKKKWWHFDKKPPEQELAEGTRDRHKKKEWPARVMKHYFVMPEDIWTPDMLVEDGLSKKSGIILARPHDKVLYGVAFKVIRPAKRAAGIIAKIDDRMLMRLAVIANLRMWDVIGREHMSQHKTD